MKSIALAIALLLAACGKDTVSSGYYPSSSPTPSHETPSPTAPETKATEPATVSRPVPPARPAVETVPATAPVTVRIPLSEYEAAKGTSLAIWETRAASLLFDFNLGGAFVDGLTDILNAGNPFYSRPKKKEGFLEREVNEYEAALDGEYYFARVRKFRAPETATKRSHYVYFLAASPDYKGKTKTRPAETAAKMGLGKADYLAPGGIGTGSEWIFTIPMSEVRSLGGFWDEKVTLQLGVLEVDVEKIRNQANFSQEEVSTPVLLFEHPVDFYHMKKNTVYKRRFQTLTPDGTPDAILDLELWKGSWRTNE